MRKFIIILSVNIFFIVSIIAGINFYWERNYQNFIRGIRIPPHNPVEIKISEYDTEESPKNLVIPNTAENNKQFCGEIRKNFGEQYKKPPIAVLGCSYAYGHGLKKEETFPFLLSEITKRPVINYSSCGSNILANFDIIYREPDNKDKLQEAQYIIYVYMHDHITRYLEPRRYNLNLFYNELFENNNFEKLLSKVFLFKYIIAELKIREILKEYPNSDKSIVFLEKIIKISQKKIKKLAPNAEFIIVLYDEKINTNYFPEDIKYHSDILYSSFWKELEKEGITVVRTKDLLGFKFDKRYKLKRDIADWHPSGKAWEVFTPEFAKKYIKP